MAVQIDKSLANRIAKKLEATYDRSGNAHDIACVWHDGVIIASFGIRRGSRNSLGHDHIPKEIGVNTRFAKELGNCTKSKQQFLQKAGHAPAEGDGP